MTITLYFIALIIMGIIDSVWLFSMGSHYRSWIGHLFAPAFSFTPAIIFYLIYAAGLVYFVISPAIEQGQGYVHIFLTGAFLGLLAYAAYDLTNQAMLQQWPIAITIIDMAWGTVLSGGVSLLTVFIYTNFIR